MVKIFYADVYFLVNFGMDLIALTLAGGLLKIKASVWRFVIAAAAGALWATFGALSAYFSARPRLYALASAAVSLVMCLAAYGEMPIKGVKGAKGAKGENRLKTASMRRFLSGWLLFFAVSCLLGGLMTAAYSFMKGIAVPDGGLKSDSSASGEGTAALFLMTAAVSCAVCAVFTRVTAYRSRRRSVAVTLTLNGKRAVFTALADSGNLLTEPLSGRPVMVVSASAVRELLPEGFTFDTSRGVPDELKARVRLITVDRLGGRVLRYAVLPDETTVDGVRRDVMFTAEDTPAGAFGGFAATINI